MITNTPSITDPKLIGMVRRLSVAVAGVKTVRERSPKRVDVCICVFLGLGTLCMIIGVGGSAEWLKSKKRGIWSSDIDKMDVEEVYSTRFFAVFGTLCSIICLSVGLLKLRSERYYKKRSLQQLFLFTLTMAFLCTLLALWILGDFGRHIREQSAKAGSSESEILKRNMLKIYEYFYKSAIQKRRNEKGILGWSYWVAVAGNLNLFVANLLFFMRKDCEKLKVTKETPVIVEVGSEEVQRMYENRYGNV